MEGLMILFGAGIVTILILKLTRWIFERTADQNYWNALMFGVTEELEVKEREIRKLRNQLQVVGPIKVNIEEPEETVNQQNEIFSRLPLMLEVGQNPTVVTDVPVMREECDESLRVEDPNISEQMEFYVGVEHSPVPSQFSPPRMTLLQEAEPPMDSFLQLLGLKRAEQTHPVVLDPKLQILNIEDGPVVVEQISLPIDEPEEKNEYRWTFGTHLLHFILKETYGEDLALCQVERYNTLTTLQYEKISEIGLDNTFVASIEVQANGNKEVRKVWKVEQNYEIKAAVGG